ncbi:MAG TPA: cytochrome c [Candidatus Baltobacteraceae bacterium]|nr:cytochrome c [Candidatus Baltobacteraceae bacterium]
MKLGRKAGSSKAGDFAARCFLIPGIVLAAVLIAYAGSPNSPSQADAAKPASPAKTTEQGVYTDAQAKQGKDVYSQNCASCHLDDLSGSGQALPLAGDSFMQSWEGQTVDDLFEVIHDTMPQDKPGTLTPDQVVNAIAYILQFNKFPSGQTALPSDPAALKAILISTKTSAPPPAQQGGH